MPLAKIIGSRLAFEDLVTAGHRAGVIVVQRRHLVEEATTSLGAPTVADQYSGHALATDSSLGHPSRNRWPLSHSQYSDVADRRLTLGGVTRHCPPPALSINKRERPTVDPGVTPAR